MAQTTTLGEQRGLANGRAFWQGLPHSGIDSGHRRWESRRVRRQVSNFHHTTTRRIVDFAVAHKITQSFGGHLIPGQRKH